MRVQTPKSRWLVPVLAACLACGCRGPEPPGPPAAPGGGPDATRDGAAGDRGAPGRGPRTYRLVGTVRSVDRESGEVAIAHEEIPGFMPAMTMPFSLEGQAVLEDLQVGDRVEATLEVGGGATRLSDVTITELAGPPGSAIDAGGGLRARRPALGPGEPVPDFAVTTQDGEALRLSDLRGKVVVLTFIYTRCPLPEFCPLMDRKFAELARRVALSPGRAAVVRLLSVSFDPEHDTPEVLSRHASLVGARRPLWTFAVASHEELARVAEPLGLTYGPTGREIVHTLSTAVIDAEGRLVRLETGGGWEVGEVMSTIAALVRRGGGGGGPG